MRVLLCYTGPAAAQGDTHEDQIHPAGAGRGGQPLLASVGQGIATASFHILTPYPGTALYERYRPRMRVHDWRRYDTRHIVFEHPTMTAEQVESGYWEAYRRFYKLRSICEGTRHHTSAALRRKHLLYATAWKKLDPLWNAVIRSALLGQARKVLERTLR